MYKYGYTPDLDTHSLKHEMWSPLQLILIITFVSVALLIYGMLGYTLCRHYHHYWIYHHQVPGPGSAGSPIRFAHPVPSSITNNEEIELSILSSTSRHSQAPRQFTYSYSSSTIDLKMMGLSVDHLTELPPAHCSSATLDDVILHRL